MTHQAATIVEVLAVVEVMISLNQRKIKMENGQPNARLYAKMLVKQIFNEQHVDDRTILICISTINIAIFLVDHIIDNFGSTVEGKPFYSSAYAVEFYQEVKNHLIKMKK